MKRKADRIDKMDKIRASSHGFPETSTCQDGFVLSLFDSLDDLLAEQCRRGPELVLSIL